LITCNEIITFCPKGQKDGGTQIKLVIDYKNGGQALFKPMRYRKKLKFCYFSTSNISLMNSFAKVSNFLCVRNIISNNVLSKDYVSNVPRIGLK
jgi:hypothetical protein